MYSTPNCGAIIRYALDNIQSPCKDCLERKIGCHSECEKYNEYTERCNNERQKVYNAYRTERLLEKSEIEGRVKTLKRRNHKYKVGVKG